MAANKGKPKPQHTQEQKLAIVQRVCDLYESQGATLASCCEAVGISDRLFYLWLAQNSEFSETYKKARNKNEEIFWDKLRPIANSAMLKLIQGGEEFEETIIKDLSYQGSLTNEKEMTVKKGKTQPNATVVIFAHKGLNPDKFAERHKIESDVTVNWHEEKTYAADSKTDEGAGLSSGQSDY